MGVRLVSLLFVFDLECGNIVKGIRTIGKLAFASSQSEYCRLHHAIPLCIG
jgi:hypothetical protein